MGKKIRITVLGLALVVTTFMGCESKSKEQTIDTALNTKEETLQNDQVVTSDELEDVSLVMWGAEEDQVMLLEMIDSFKKFYADQANFNIQLLVQEESTAKDTILVDVKAAADVFSFVDDQLYELIHAGALHPISIDVDEIIAANGGPDSSSVKAATKDETLFAYPMTADNGYFMFYDKSIFTDQDVKTLDKMMEIAAKEGKKITIDYSSGWYLYSFFSGAGLTLSLNDDGITNSCTWNATNGTYTGEQVAKAMLEIANNPGFISVGDQEFANGILDGTIVAGVNGTWNAATAETAWGENYAAVKLPTYTVGGDQVQMSSFAGYKLVGVSAYSKFPGWSMLLGEWITNYENQVKRFEQRGLGPSNVEAGLSESVKSSPAIAALSEQSRFATVQHVGGKFWNASSTFGLILADGNLKNTDLQILLDDMVFGITEPIQ